MEKNKYGIDDKYFIYLDNLRESGITNMFGSAPFLAEEFDIPRSEAVKIVSKWMDTFDKRHPEDD